MANKDVTYTEPTASDITTIVLRCAGGAVTSVEIACDVQSNDSDGYFAGNTTAVPGDFSANIQTELNNLVIEAAAKVSSDKGFV